MTTKSEISSLTEKWFDYVSKDHHKDRDCHFYINIDYAYGREPIYEISHYGYVGQEFTEEAKTLEEAETKLLAGIKAIIAKERTWASGVLKTSNNWDSYQIRQAQDFIKLFGE